MLNFIDNLVHKACGASLLTKPEPSLTPDFEMFSLTSVSPEKRSPDAKSMVEDLPAEPSRDFPANFDESIHASKTASEELSSTSSVGNHASSEETFHNPLKKPEILEFNTRGKGPPAPSKVDYEEASPKSEDIPPAADQPSLNMKDAEKTDSGKPAQHSSVDISPAVNRQSINLKDAEKRTVDKPVAYTGASIPEFGWEKQTGPSISPEPQVGDQHDNSNKFTKPQPEPDVVDSESKVCQPTLEMPPVKAKSPLTQKDEIHIVNVEPAVEVQQQTFIKGLIKKTNGAALSSAAERRDVKTTRVPPDKEVRVNIGRIEIKASQQASPPVKPAPRGFEDHLLARVYLDRHYF